MTPSYKIQTVLDRFAALLDDPDLSPQFVRKLSQLVTCWQQHSNNTSELINSVARVFDRLLLELIQAHFTTKQREQDLMRLIKRKGCSISDPKLIDQVVELLTRLYKAAGQCNDTWYERQALIKYIAKEQGVSKSGSGDNREKEIARIVQTIYMCSCFDVTKQDGARSSRWSLKENLYDPGELRNHIDTELIKLAQENCIRLSPDRWAYLLHGRSDRVARLQPILEQHLIPVSVDELRVAINKSGDRLNLQCHLESLNGIQNLISEIRSTLSMEQQQTIARPLDGNRSMHFDYLMADILERLANLQYLFTARQHRVGVSLNN